MKKIFYIVILLATVVGCSKEELFQENIRLDYWMFHKGAELPVVVEGNTNSRIFLIMLHGGPGGSAQEFNAFNEPFTDLLEDKYAMVYYDQRNSGMARGEWDESLYTVEQHIEDLDKVIEFLAFKFGSDIQIFLSGHSWGGYLGSAFLVTGENQKKVKSWINIDGQINRNKNYTDRLVRIPEIANEQIALENYIDEWTAINEEIETERLLGITQYSPKTESNLNGIMARCETLLSKSGIFTPNVNGTAKGVYANNYHPFIAGANGNRSKVSLLTQMYDEYDETIATNLSKLTLPTLSIYGKYDVRTPLQQGEYLIDNVSTPVDNKTMVVIDKAGHSPMRTETVALADAIVNWIERYR
jgi:pimeloyl-ACP methyl ester carboxylesterase